MAKSSSKRPRIGDIVELRTPKGLAYGQFSHFHDKPPKFGYLLRILRGTFESRPKSFARLVDDEEQFNVFFPLAACLKRGDVEVVGNEPVPVRSEAFPTFRNGVHDPKTGKVNTWWLWDGEREWKVGELTDEIRKLSFLRICDDESLIEYIAAGYSPTQEV